MFNAQPTGTIISRRLRGTGKNPQNKTNKQTNKKNPTNQTTTTTKQNKTKQKKQTKTTATTITTTTTTHRPKMRICLLETKRRNKALAVYSQSFSTTWEELKILACPSISRESETSTSLRLLKRFGGAFLRVDRLLGLVVRRSPPALREADLDSIPAFAVVLFFFFFFFWSSYQ